MLNEDDEFAQITQRVMADAALDVFAESTQSMGRMLEVITDMSSRVAQRAYDSASKVDETMATNLYHEIFVGVWARTIDMMSEASRRVDQMQAIADILGDGDGDDNDGV